MCTSFYDLFLRNARPDLLVSITRSSRTTRAISTYPALMIVTFPLHIENTKAIYHGTINIQSASEKTVLEPDICCIPESQASLTCRCFNGCPKTEELIGPLHCGGLTTAGQHAGGTSVFIHEATTEQLKREALSAQLSNHLATSFAWGNLMFRFSSIDKGMKKG
jgi:hypothetical protein